MYPSLVLAAYLRTKPPKIRIYGDHHNVDCMLYHMRSIVRRFWWLGKSIPFGRVVCYHRAVGVGCAEHYDLRQAGCFLAVIVAVVVAVGAL